MPDTRFHRRGAPLTVAEIAALTGAVITKAEDGGKVLQDVAPLSTATDTDLAFLDNRKYLDQFKATKAGACFVRPEFADDAPHGVTPLVTTNPYRAYALAAQRLYPDAASAADIAPSAVIDPSANIGNGCNIGANVFIGANVVVGDNVRVMPNATLMDGVVIGEGSEIGANASLSHCIVGKRVRILPGAAIGQPGFGFAFDEKGFVPVPQLGRVIIEDDCEIGANTTIDRGAGPDTVIGQGTRIDNLVQIGHNVRIGRHCVIVAQTGISGSTQLGDFVMTGGQAGIAGHLKIENGARIAAQSGIMRDVPASGEYMGSPALPIKQYLRQVAVLARLSKNRGKE